MWAAIGAQALQGLLAGGQRQRQARAENQQIIKANIENTARTRVRAGLIDAAASVAGAQEKQARIRIRQSLSGYLGTAQNQAAAAGVIGASVDAVANDAILQASTALQEQEQNWEVTRLNLEQSYSDLYTNLIDSLQGASSAPSFGSSLVSSVLGAAVNVGSQYALAKMQLGLPKGG